MVWWHLYIVILMVSATLGLILTPVCQKLAVLTDFMDRPQVQEHKGHKKATPLLGGIALFSAWIITIVAGFLATEFVDVSQFGKHISDYLPGVKSVSRDMMVLGIGAFLAVVLGLVDDRYNMSAKTKLIGQILIAAIVSIWGGVEISVFISVPYLSTIITIGWFVVVFNSINFFDNMDGLAVGTSAIALAFFALAAAVNQQYFVAALGAASAGSCIGFWFYNHSPATIFMGDSGSHFLGYMLAVISAKVTYYNHGISTTRFPILFPMFILAIPLFDSLAVIVIRYKLGKPIYIGDHNHISHRFVAMGMSRKRAVFIVHLLALTVGLSVLPLLWGDERTTIVSLVQACTILLLVSMLQYAVIAKPDDSGKVAEQSEDEDERG